MRRAIRWQWGPARLLVLLVLAAVPTGAWCHALAPSLLDIEAAGSDAVGSDALGGSRYAVQWKTPQQRVPGSELQPRLPAHCATVEPTRTALEGTGVVWRWVVDCGARGLIGSTVSVRGIAGSRADVILRIKLEDGRALYQVLKPGQDSYQVPARQAWYRIAQSYAVMGVEHLVGGVDHVLFVIALFMLVGVRRELIWTVTMFTLGHSVTLSMAVLGVISFSQGLAETLIALSIIVAFTEVLTHPGHSLQPWKVYAMAGGFGLLHGLGFAGALREVGLPQGDIPLALFAFNVGIELGQLALIVLLCALTLALGRLGLRWRGAWRQLPVYAAGSLAGFWFWQRLLAAA